MTSLGLGGAQPAGNASRLRAPGTQWVAFNPSSRCARLTRKERAHANHGHRRLDTRMMLQNDPLWTPEQRLIAAIIVTAYRDMLTDIESRSKHGADSTPVQQNDVDRAIHFLTDRSGGTARLRNHYCSLLDIDGDLLAERMRRMLNGDLDMPYFSYEAPSNPEGRKRALARHAERVAAARARWFHLKFPTSTSRPRSARTPAAVTL